MIQILPSVFLTNTATALAVFLDAFRNSKPVAPKASPTENQSQIFLPTSTNSNGVLLPLQGESVSILGNNSLPPSLYTFRMPLLILSIPRFIADPIPTKVKRKVAAEVESINLGSGALFMAWLDKITHLLKGTRYKLTQRTKGDVFRK